ncbi:enoyl-CoA hydratase-related protein, partial [Vibrio parahaemolyticus]
VVLSRPQQRNAVDHDHAEALYEAFLAFDRDAKARVAVFWGEGGAFCAGWDLKAAAAGAGRDLLAGLDIPADPSAPLPRGPMGPSRLEL